MASQKFLLTAIFEQVYYQLCPDSYRDAEGGFLLASVSTGSWLGKFQTGTAAFTLIIWQLPYHYLYLHWTKKQ